MIVKKIRSFVAPGPLGRMSYFEVFFSQNRFGDLDLFWWIEIDEQKFIELKNQGLQQC